MNKEDLIGIIEDTEIIEGKFLKDQLSANLEAAPIEVMINDHNKLDNRDLPDQHPIESITGLKKEIVSIKQNQQSTLLSIRTLTTKIDNKIRSAKSIPSDMQKGEFIFLEKEEIING